MTTAHELAVAHAVSTDCKRLVRLFLHAWMLVGVCVKQASMHVGHSDSNRFEVGVAIGARASKRVGQLTCRP
jgi:hypothetical protein